MDIRTQSTGNKCAIRRIATEEAFTIPEIVAALRKAVKAPSRNLDLDVLRRVYGDSPGAASGLVSTLLDVDDQRIQDMDKNGVAIHLLSLTCPGVQIFDADTATDLAVVANDRLSEAVGRHPTRYAGLACFAPQSPLRAAKEMERAIKQLKLNGFIVNSHTNNEYLDNSKYWPILEAAEALDACIYLHPRAPSDGMADPFRDYGLDNATWGFGIETATHAVRLILSGVLDRFPNLRLCLGHMGEAVHFWLYRIDLMQARAQSWGIVPKLQLKPSEYFRRNFVITTCGQEDHMALDFSIKKLGVANVLWSIDYPFQPTDAAVSFMDTAPITDAERANIYHLNAERVFHITA